MKGDYIKTKTEYISNHKITIIQAPSHDLIELYASLTSELQTDILSDYGYPIFIMVENTDLELA